ncbi:MAG: hypothetical protein JNG84_01315 [Archangium sp.]|nr:hypothetical protein [Archangium sp.]
MKRDDLKRDDVTCDDVELALVDGPLSPEADRHLQSCLTCQASAAVLQAAELDPPTPVERAVVATFAGRLSTAWRARAAQRRVARGAAGYGAAAAIGALAASMFFLFHPAEAPVPDVAPVAPVALAQADVSLDEWVSDETVTAEDSEFFDVSWPAVSEGDSQ